MRFWITLMVGAVLVTAVSTAVYFANPEMAAAPPPPVVVSAPIPATGDLPVAFAESNQETLSNLPQMKDGESKFIVRNDGKGELELRPGAVSCTCAGAKIVKVGGDGIPQPIVKLAPGEKAEFIVAWATKERVGPFSVDANLLTNDPVRGQMKFTIAMNIERDVMFEPEGFAFGLLSEGEQAERTAFVFSTLHDGVVFSEPTCSTEAIQVRIQPASKEELQRHKAKSGAQLIAKVVGVMPVGDFLEKYEFKTSLQRTPHLHLPIVGRITGQIDVAPSQIDFGVVGGAKDVEKKVHIFAKGLDPKRTLLVAEADPKYLKVRLERDKQIGTHWLLTAVLPAGSPVGPVEGKVVVADDLKVKRLIVAVSGTVSGSAVPVTTGKSSKP